MSTYHWKLGDIALARICRKVYAKIKVVKNEDGLFYDNKVLAMTTKEDGTISTIEELCYYVEISRTGQKLWLPYTSLRLAERSRPFYGSLKEQPVVKTIKPEKPSVPKKRKIREDHILPLSVKISKQCKPELNTTFESRHTPLAQGKYENAFMEFMRRGKEMLFDQFYYMLEQNAESNLDLLDYLQNVDASTEDKLEAVIKDVISEKEIEKYLHQCWRYNFVQKQMAIMENKENIDDANTPPVQITQHTSWCLVCGTSGRLRDCPACPSTFHLACRREWLVSLIHRKNPPQKPQQPTSFVRKILSSTRILKTVNKDCKNTELCPSCMWGPKVGYDDVVWHKLGTCSWWPARVLTPGAVPACLLSRSHAPTDWPLRYYGTLNHAWGESSRMSLFLPSHMAVLPNARDPMLQQGIMDACDDYIVVYLT